MSIVGNIAMFIIAAVICYGLMRGFRGWMAERSEAAGYMLVTTAVVQAGEEISAANAQWKPIRGRKPSGVLSSNGKATPIDGYVATMRIAADRPVRSVLVAKEETAVVRTGASLTGFVLSEEDLGAVTPFLRRGDKVDIIAIVGAGKSAKPDVEPLSVATVVNSAEVTGLIKPVAVGRSGRRGAAVIGVTSEQARLLGLLRQVARLEVVLAPARADEGRYVYPFIPWQDAGSMGVSTARSLVRSDYEYSAPAEPASVVGASEPRSQPSVAMITPSGTTQAIVPN